MDFHWFKDMDLVEQVHIFGLTNIHTFGPNISLIRRFSLMLNYAKPRLTIYFIFMGGLQSYTVDHINIENIAS